MITLKQGESYRIYLNLRQDGAPLIPEMVADVKICIGSVWSKTYKSGGVMFDFTKNQWFIFPTQAETLAMKEGRFSLCCHVKYQDSSVIITDLDTIRIVKSCCGEVF